MNKLIDVFKSILGGIGSILFVIFIIVMWSAQIKSCFIFDSTNKSSEKTNNHKILEASLDNSKHHKLLVHMKKIYASLGLEDKKQFHVYFINEENSLNAASFGDGKYIFWETLANLPDWAIDSILAHEIAHDLLLHSRKMRDADDLKSFFTEILSMVGGADRNTEKTLQDWSSKLILPKYSKSQEYEADEYAAEILFKCGYEKPELIFSDTLSLIKNKFGDSGGGFFDFHPSTNERVQHILASQK